MITYTVNIDYGDRVQEGLTLPEALRELRNDTGQSMEAIRIESGLAYVTIQRTETQTTAPNIDTLTKLFIALGVDTVEVKYGMYAEPGRVMVNVYV